MCALSSWFLTCTRVLTHCSWMPSVNVISSVALHAMVHRPNTPAVVEPVISLPDMGPKNQRSFWPIPVIIQKQSHVDSYTRTCGRPPSAEPRGRNAVSKVICFQSAPLKVWRARSLGRFGCFLEILGVVVIEFPPVWTLTPKQGLRGSVRKSSFMDLCVRISARTIALLVN